MAAIIHCSAGNITGVRGFSCSRIQHTPRNFRSFCPIFGQRSSLTKVGLALSSRYKLLRELPRTGQRSSAAGNESTHDDEVPVSAVDAQQFTNSHTLIGKVSGEQVPASKEGLVLGTQYTGVVRSVQTYGAFVQFGSLTGMVHVSNLSKKFVADATKFVSVGQEVKVRIVGINEDAGRISLSMREGDNTETLMSQSEDSRRWEDEGGFYKGQELVASLKKRESFGLVVALPGGYEGLLVDAEDFDTDFLSYIDVDTMRIGDPIDVIVMRITEGGVVVKQKKIVDENADKELTFYAEPVLTATSPFLLAFRKSKAMMAYLKRRDKLGDLYQIQEKPDKWGRYDRKPEYCPLEEDPPPRTKAEKRKLRKRKKVYEFVPDLEDEGDD